MMHIAGTGQTWSNESVRKGKGSFWPKTGHWPVALSVSDPNEYGYLAVF